VKSGSGGGGSLSFFGVIVSAVRTEMIEPRPKTSEIPSLGPGRQAQGGGCPPQPHLKTEKREKRARACRQKQV